MEVILVEKIDRLGGLGDLVNVKSGFARNYLLPTGKAKVATAENIAAYLYREISAQLNTDTIKVSAVTLWETERACVKYSEENE